MSAAIRVVIADDHRLMRRAICAVLAANPDIEVVATARDGTEALRLCREHNPDVLLLDLQMPGPPASSVVRVMASSHPPVPVLILTIFDIPQFLSMLFKVGLSGYIIKDDAAEQLVPALHAVAQGKQWTGRARRRYGQGGGFMPPAPLRMNK